MLQNGDVNPAGTGPRSATAPAFGTTVLPPHTRDPFFMSDPILNYADLLLRIVKLEARIISLEQQLSERGAAPKKEWVQLSDDSVIEVRTQSPQMNVPLGRGSHYWVLGEPAGSTPVGDQKEVA